MSHLRIRLQTKVLSKIKYKQQESYIEHLVYDKDLLVNLAEPFYGLDASDVSLAEEIVRQYLQKQRKYFALDFDDLLYFTFYIGIIYFRLVGCWMSPKQNLATYLQEISLLTSMDVNDSSKDRVKLMTIHTAKGLEFPYVFLCGFSDGILPNYRFIQERREEAMEEERRLAYVAITRAQKELYLTESEGWNHQARLEKRPSRFLLRLPESLYVREGVIPKELLEIDEPEYVSNAVVSQQYELKINDKVHHPILGEGYISIIDESKELYGVYFHKIHDERLLSFDFINSLTSRSNNSTSDQNDNFLDNQIEQMLSESYTPTNDLLSKKPNYAKEKQVSSVEVKEDIHCMDECEAAENENNDCYETIGPYRNFNTDF